ncbi:predicted membrane protein [Corynebacterium kutscheri]|uniref:Predicted membrane protein n=1 Tax=Corynebacterium kutscheri TaxID=35755 RepID=A0A0F6R0Y4_9CORY|nr:trimeric intracellular cation channel family protein [Corynebacterium kutscheri]AKE41987.1 putative membrane protein [Corynebacterium kutscheri]VEH06216.1 predicted membrane protein [Corynebacterium kutscheri]VEH10328.1 predicted membrane protein [Corynebacterium kutscheri]VEH82133.1 predicted membrane protein [Corynebacterium kutscheri]
MSEVDPFILTLYRCFDLIGVVLNGVIGGTIARQRNFDFVGFMFLALFSALGGGMLRDVLIQAGPAAAIAVPWYLPLAVGGAFIALITHLSGRTWEYFRVHADAIILGVWSVTGCVKALANDLPIASAILMGVLTAVGGGMIRDVVIGQIPMIFGGSPLYTVPALVSSIAMVSFHAVGYDALGMIVSPILGAGLVIISYWRNWQLFRNSEWAPVNMTAAQLKILAKKSETVSRGMVRGRGIKIWKSKDPE